MEAQSISQEDMEKRLVLLFRKMIVFSSKIESLKEKILKTNPDFSSYRLFMNFSGSDNNKMDQMGLYQFFQFFGFNHEPHYIKKIMIYLSKFKIEEQSGFCEGMGVSAQEKNFSRYQSGISHSNGQNLSISYADFKDIMVVEGCNDIDWAMNNAPTDEVNLQSTEMHLIRQILMLLKRKLTDIGNVVNTLRVYTSEEIFNYLLKFNTPDHVRITQDSFEQNNAMMQNEYNQFGDLRPNFQPPQAISQNRFIPDENGNIVSSGNGFERGGFDDQSAISLNMAGGNMMLNRFAKKNINVQQKIFNRTEVKFLDIETICNFLEFQDVQFLPEDANYILKDIGVSTGSISFETLKKFFESSLWM